MRDKRDDSEYLGTVHSLASLCAHPNLEKNLPEFPNTQGTQGKIPTYVLTVWPRAQCEPYTTSTDA